MDFPFIIELMEYWADYPPEHLLMRALVGYEGSAEAVRRGRQFGDDRRASKPTNVPTADKIQDAIQGSTGARHLDCAPPHIQLAIERAKLGKHLDVPGVPNAR